MRVRFLIMAFLLTAMLPLAGAAGSNWKTATLMNSGDTKSGQLSDTHKEDWYKIVVPEKQDGTAKFIITCSDGLEINRIELYTLTGDEIQFRYWVGEDGQPTVSDMASGTYYVRVSHHSKSGSYNLDYTFTPNATPNDAEPNDTYDTGELLESGKTATGHLGYRYYGEDTRDKEDWYKIVVPEKQSGTAKFIITCSDGLEVNLIELYALTGNEIQQRNIVGQDGQPTVSDLASGTYYVRLSYHSKPGSYNLDYTFTPIATPIDAEPNDTYDTGELLESGKTATGHLGYRYSYSGEDTHDREDWYKIVVPKKQSGTAKFSITCSDGLEINSIELYTLTGNEIQQRNYGGVDGHPLTVSDMASGTYYVRISLHSKFGSYNLDYTFTPNAIPIDAEPNDTYDTGELLESGKTATGHLGYRYSGEDTRDKEDWYKIEVKAKGDVLLSVKPDTLSTLFIGWLSLNKKDGEKLSRIASTVVIRGKGQIKENDVEPGTYYVQVHHSNGAGGYSLTYGNPVPAMGSQISIDVTGRNKVRLGVPCRYTMTIRNHSCNNTGSFLVSVCGTDDIKMLGAELPTNRGIQKLSMNDIGNEGDPVMWFVVPDLSPYEKYSFDFFVEGQDVTEPNFTTALVVGAIGSVVGGVVSDYASDYISEYASEKIELNETERQQYVQALGKAVEQSFEQKAKDGAVVFTAKSVLSTAAEKAMELFPGGSIVTKAGKTMDIVSAVSTALRHRLYYWLYKEVGLINDGSSVLDGKVPADGVVASWDPNEKTGPKGYGEDNFLAKPQRMTYTIFFENKKEATAPAHRIRIEDTLADAFDPETVQFGPTSHSGNGYYWQMSREGNKLTWDIEGIELPPNVNAPEGEGYVSFSVYLKDGVKNGDAIENRATVTFDKNKPIETNVWRNVIDTEAPVTKMLPVSYVAGTDHVTVTCQSDDNKDGSGINRYLFYVSKNDEPFVYFTESNEPKLEYPVDKSRTDTYGFYALAVDNVGNTEQTAPDAVIVNTQTSISDVVAERISVSPNPSEGIFRATLPSSVSELTVYATSGQMVWKASTTSLTGTVEINLADHPAGVYLLKAVVDGKVSTMKLIKK